MNLQLACPQTTMVTPEEFSEAVVRRCFKIGALEKFKKKILFNEGFQLHKKETPTPVFFCKICDIFKNTFLIAENLRSDKIQFILFDTRQK